MGGPLRLLSKLYKTKHTFISFLFKLVTTIIQTYFTIFVLTQNMVTLKPLTLLY